MGILDAWRKFRAGGVGLGVSFKLDENLKPVSIGQFPIERKSDDDKGEVDASFTENDPVRKFKTSDWRTLPIKEWVPHTFWCYFAALYLEETKFPYGKRTIKESMLVKRLVAQYGNEPTKRVIEYVLRGHRTLKYLRGSRPTVSFIYGFRATLVPEAHEGRISMELTDKEHLPEDVNKW